MPRKNLIYEAYKDDEMVFRGTANELADHFGVQPQTIGNCERTGNPLRSGYRIERVGYEDWQTDVDIDNAIKADIDKGLSRSVIATRLGVNKGVIDNRIQAMRKRGEL